MANIVLGIFAAIFFICILTGSELLYALGAGFFLFVGYGLYKKYSLSDVLSMAWKGVMSVRTIFIVFMLIGMLTGVWRASGTIAYIITLASDFIEPSIFILIAFLLNCAVSFLLGTSFGTSATMGVITMSIGMTIGMPPAMVGGAILAGVYFGDRMSPVSTSALLVSVLTEVDLYTNIRNMAKSAVLPFLISCVIYLLLEKCFQMPPRQPQLLQTLKSSISFRPSLRCLPFPFSSSASSAYPSKRIWPSASLWRRFFPTPSRRRIHGISFSS